jgi:hypothetical protein
MNIQDIEMQCQSDPRYKDEIMTFPKWQVAPDKIGDYGCLLTAKLNCFNLFNRNKKYLTLKELNDLMIKKNGYNYLFYMKLFNNDEKKSKAVCYQQESCSIPIILNEILGIKDEVQLTAGSHIDIENPNYYYIVRTMYKNTGHYSMVVRDNLMYLDSYDCKIKLPENILNIYRLQF